MWAAIGLGLVIWLLLSVVLGCIVGRHLRGEEKPAEIQSPQGRRRRLGLLVVDGEVTVRYEMAPAKEWPRYFRN